MIASLTATAVALAVGLPIVALGERIREREGNRPIDRHTSPTRKDTPWAGTQLSHR
nr:MAG TPA: hypothetical protein [Caudoviricetes sp.]